MNTHNNNDTVELKLYQSRDKIHPREVKGRFQTLRKLAAFLLLGLFYVLPWINWNGRQALLFDLPQRRFYIFDLTLWPQDFIYLAGLLIIAAFSLFFFTALAGRLWCGFACPQTVWTEVFIFLEQIIEGNRHKRIKLDAAPWSFNKLRIKLTKQLLWITFALWTGYTFVGFFSPIRELAMQIQQWSLGPWEAFWLFFYAFATYGNAGFLREQVCLYMCPYARFQSAMFDKDTLIISYDEQRGEPRMRGKKRKINADAGDCIDCTLCVQACPTGIDIRNGLQYECIACAACIDVCDDVMQKNDKPLGLIKYTTEHKLEGQKTRVLRPRIVLYSLLLLSICSIFLMALINRSGVDVNIIHDRNSFYRYVDKHTIENVYTIKIMNKTPNKTSYTITASGIEGLEVIMKESILTINSGQLIAVPISIRAAKNKANQKIHDITVSVRSTDGKQNTQEKTNYFGHNKKINR